MALVSRANGSRAQRSMAGPFRCKSTHGRKTCAYFGFRISRTRRRRVFRAKLRYRHSHTPSAESGGRGGHSAARRRLGPSCSNVQPYVYFRPSQHSKCSLQKYSNENYTRIVKSFLSLINIISPKRTVNEATRAFKGIHAHGRGHINNRTILAHGMH